MPLAFVEYYQREYDSRMSKRELDEARKEECRQLKAIFNDKKKALGLTQEKLAHALDMNQSSVSHYLNGVNPLNAHVASEMAKILDVPVSDFSERLAKEIEQYVSLARSLEQSAAIRNAKDGVIKNGDHFRMPPGMTAVRRPVLPNILPGAIASPVGAAAGSSARAGVAIEAESEEDADSLERVIGGAPMLARIRRVRAALSEMTSEEAELLARKAVGCPKHATEILVLLDSVLEAAIYDAIDLEEIQAITTLVKKRRNEKVHGVGVHHRKET